MDIIELSQNFDPALILNRDISWHCSCNKFLVQQCKLFRDGFTYRIHALILSGHEEKWGNRHLYTQELLMYQWLGICPQWVREMWKP